MIIKDDKQFYINQANSIYYLITYNILQRDSKVSLFVTQTIDRMGLKVNF